MKKSGTKKVPTRKQYMRCAEIAQESNELSAFGMLAGLLEKETRHAYLCQLGVWYWQIGHRQLAAACYRRSLELSPEPPTYFNLAVCLDDLAARFAGDSDVSIRARDEYSQEAQAAMRAFCELVPAEERKIAEEMLKQNGKDHLIQREGNPANP